MGSRQRGSPIGVQTEREPDGVRTEGEPDGVRTEGEPDGVQTFRAGRDEAVTMAQLRVQLLEVRVALAEVTARHASQFYTLASASAAAEAPGAVSSGSLEQAGAHPSFSDQHAVAVLHLSSGSAPRPDAHDVEERVSAQQLRVAKYKLAIQQQQLKVQQQQLEVEELELARLEQAALALRGPTASAASVPVAKRAAPDLASSAASPMSEDSGDEHPTPDEHDTCIVEAIGDADTPVTEVTVLQLRLALLRLRAPYPSLIAAARPLARPRSPPTQTAQPPSAQPPTTQPPSAQPPTVQPPFTLSQMAQPQQTIVQPPTAQQPALIPETSGSAPQLLLFNVDAVNQPRDTAFQSLATVATTWTPALVAGLPWSPASSDINESLRVAESLAATVRTQNQLETPSEFRLIFDFRPIIANLLAPDPGRHTNVETKQHRLPQARPQGAFLCYPQRGQLRERAAPAPD